jgi:hypothetical protein
MGQTVYALVRMRVRGYVFALLLAGAPALLGGCPTVDLGDTPEDVGQCNPTQGEPYFEQMIWPTYINNSTKSCVTSGCHESQTGQSALRFDIATPVDYQTNYRAAQVYLSCATPSSSELLTKPLAGTTAHGGGDIFPSLSDPAVVVFLAWFNP